MFVLQCYLDNGYRLSHYSNNMSCIHQMSDIGDKYYLSPCSMIFWGHHISLWSREQILGDIMVALGEVHCQGMSDNQYSDMECQG